MSLSKLRHPLALSALASACHLALAQSVFAPTPTEYSWSTTVNELGMSNVHSRGILGQGALVAVLDTGINPGNPEFSGNTRIVARYNAVDGSADVTDSIGHGTHVTGILAAPGNGTGMYGVAPLASIMMVKVFNGGTAAASAINRGIDYAVAHGARVINLSLGATGPTGDASLRAAAATNNTLVVVAAGNDTAATPSWPARYARESWANGTILAVGAVDANKHLLSFSNRAGDTAQNFLVAPGLNILSSYGTGYAYMTGTSMAAPAVSGAAALITGYWPYLKANQVAAILLNTADDLGAPGVDAVYGHGLLNVNRALSPIGSYSYRLPTGGKVTVPLSVQGVSSARPMVATPSAFRGLTTEVFDDYGRNFTSDEGTALTGHSAMTVDSLLGQPNQMLDAAEQVLAGGGRLMRLQSLQTNPQGSGASDKLGLSGEPWNRRPHADDASMVRLQVPSGEIFSAGDGGLAGLSMGLMGSSLATRLSGTENLLSNPLLGFAPRHQFASFSAPLQDHWRVGFGAARSRLYDAASGDVNLFELTYDHGGRALNVSAGQLTEQGLLGGWSKPILGLNQQTGTSGITISGAWALNAAWTLTGAFSSTHTGAPGATGMLTQATPIDARAYGVGLVRGDTWRDGDRLSFSVSTPLHATSGALTYSIVTGVTADGEPIYGTRTVNLKPTAQEWIAEARYGVRLTRNATLSTVLALRMHADHDESAPAQLVAGLRYVLGF